VPSRRGQSSRVLWPSLCPCRVPLPPELQPAPTTSRHTTLSPAWPSCVRPSFWTPSSILRLVAKHFLSFQVSGWRSRPCLLSGSEEGSGVQQAGQGGRGCPTANLRQMPGLSEEDQREPQDLALPRVSDPRSLSCGCDKRKVSSIKHGK
jgi:hypothetical protein